MTQSSVPVTRFAPSPTGYLHLGHAHSALFAWRSARSAGGRFLLRVEDIDAGRCRPEFEAAILEDLGWLGLDWETPVRRQSDHLRDYAAALARLEAQGLLYPCFCSRAEASRAASAPHDADRPPLYPGTCRKLPVAERAALRAEGRAFALRLDSEATMAKIGPLFWTDRRRGRIAADPLALGDVVLARKDTPTSYHLAVTVDDALQGVTLITRGEDLFESTHVHRMLQALLDLPTPEYDHHTLLLGTDGKRLAKRDRAATLRALREAGKTPAETRALAGFDGRDEVR